MEAKEAIAFAKRYFADLFSEEGIANLGLEEVEYDDARDFWRITLGFSRMPPSNDPLRMILPVSRIYKVLTIADSDKKVISIKNREVEAA